MDSGIIPEYNLAEYFLSLGVLFVLLGLCWFGVRLLRRRGSWRFLTPARGLQIESRLSLGPKKLLLVLKYRDKRLLLGVTEQQISLLDSSPLEEYPEEEEPGEDAPADVSTEGRRAVAAGLPDFRNLLHGLGKKK
ncbi:MAG: flagellar biosynthetic protein FliO [Deltaproteobacteria bacterium]|jgi:flagellar protein FliO/FliZ|nr:flagellar biosynthetic protein FliO [Deltaproteobacteria bacterium]